MSKNLKRRLLLAHLRLGMWIFALIALWVLLKIPWVSKYSVKDIDQTFAAEREDVLARRAYLVSRFNDGSMNPHNMPFIIGEFFQGEWAFGTCSMTATALTNIAFLYPETRAESLDVVKGIIELMLSEHMAAFNTRAWGEDALKSLDGSNGHIAYLGHLNLVLGAHRLLGGGKEYDELHKKITASLIRRLRESSFPYLETYPDEIYSSDNMVVYASIKFYDEIFGADSSELFFRLSKFTREKALDPKTGLVHLWLDKQGRPVGAARGSLTGWNIFYISFFDTAFAKEQYENAKKSLIVSLPLGAKGLREYAVGVSGSADIDSGPVILGIGTSGTGFILAGARLAKDVETLSGLLLTAEVVGTTVQFNGGRRYLFAPLVGDAIVLAMRTVMPWDKRFIEHEVQE